MSFKVKHWQDVGHLVAGVWMIVSPWVLAYQAETRPAFNAATTSDRPRMTAGVAGPAFFMRLPCSSYRARTRPKV